MISTLVLALAFAFAAFAPAPAAATVFIGAPEIKRSPDALVVTFRFDGDFNYRKADTGAGVRLEGVDFPDPSFIPFDAGIEHRRIRTCAPQGVVLRLGKGPAGRLRIVGDGVGGARIDLLPGNGILLETDKHREGRTFRLRLFAYLPVSGEDFAAIRAAAAAASITGKPVVLIDAGHGGMDTGTSHGGVVEKEVNLLVARAVARDLRVHGVGDHRHGVYPILTRTTDRFVTLPRRRFIARLLGADLFLSIHVNANADRRCNGFEIYRLSVDGSRTQAKTQLEDRENALLPGDADLPDPVLAGILVDLKRNRVLHDASTMAGILNFRLAGALPADTPVRIRTGDFRVLNNLETPSLLLELGYCTNAGDRAILKDRDALARLAGGITDAVLDYFHRSCRPSGTRPPSRCRPVDTVTVVEADPIRDILAPRLHPVAPGRNSNPRAGDRQ